MLDLHRSTNQRQLTAFAAYYLRQAEQARTTKRKIAAQKTVQEIMAVLCDRRPGASL